MTLSSYARPVSENATHAQDYLENTLGKYFLPEDVVTIVTALEEDVAPQMDDKIYALIEEKRFPSYMLKRDVFYETMEEIAYVAKPTIKNRLMAHCAAKVQESDFLDSALRNFVFEKTDQANYTSQYLRKHCGL